jgi:hypothetical protein
MRPRPAGSQTKAPPTYGFSILARYSADRRIYVNCFILPHMHLLAFSLPERRGRPSPCNAGLNGELCGCAALQRSTTLGLIELLGGKSGDHKAEAG